jgi:putative intracellular protease/amidase
VRWLYHLCVEPPQRPGPYAPASLAKERFVHTSYRDDLLGSAHAHFKNAPRLSVLQIDPRRLSAPVKVDATPRGPMPHVYGPIDADAIRGVLTMEEAASAPDTVEGTRFAFVAFDGMTLLDLVMVHDPLSRIASMGFDPTTRCEIVGGTGARVWTKDGAELLVEKIRPPLADYDVVIVPGGLASRTLSRNRDVIGWLEAFPKNRLMASVCTGALLLGAAGRLMGLRATTHHSAMNLLEAYGARPTTARVVDEGQSITAGGVTCALDLGVFLLRRYVDDDAVRKIAEQMELVQ